MQLSNVCSFERVSMCGVYWEEWYERLVMGEEARRFVQLVA